MAKKKSPKKQEAFDITKQLDKAFGLRCSGLTNENYSSKISKNVLDISSCSYASDARTAILSEPGGMCKESTELTEEQFIKIFSKVKKENIPVYTKSLNKALRDFEFTPVSRNHFLAQIAHESVGLTQLEENLKYSESGLIKTFSYYKNHPDEAKADARKSETIANKVYNDANREKSKLGNNNPGDGWKYRGRGAIQITGKNNYSEVGKGIGIDIVTNPDLLLDPATAIRASAYWWKKNKMHSVSSENAFDILVTSRKVNGVASHQLTDGNKKFFIKLPHGIKDRQERFISIGRILGL